MSWTTIVWSMGASACLTLSAVHLVIGLRRPAAANFLVFATGLAVAALAAFELILMKSPVPEEHAWLLRWAHIPIAAIVVSLVLFVWSHVWSGRRWLGWLAIGFRLACLALNFLVEPNFTYSQITGVRPIRFLGETVYLPVGVVSVRGLMGLAASLLLVAFLADATRAAWRRRERRPTAIVGASITLFVVLLTVMNVLTIRGLLDLPFMISLSFLGVVAAMEYELGIEVIRASQLELEVQASAAGLVNSRRHAIRATRAAEQAEERFRLVVEASPSAMVMVDGEGRIALVNTQTEAVFGYRREELLGRSVETLIPERFHSRHLFDRKAYLGAPTSRAMGAGRELFGRRKDGREVPVEVGLNPIHSQEGVFALASIIDISERQRAEQELNRQRSELAHLSRVTMLGELSGSLAHELNQPLSAILTNAQAARRFLARSPANLDEVSQILGDIVEQDKRAGEVIRRLRLLLTKGQVHPQPLDLDDAILEALRLVRSDLLDQGVVVNTDFTPAASSVRGDRIQIQQVVLNLVRNGCDAMAGLERSRRLLTISTAGDGAGFVQVSVSDHGTGIPADHLPRLFEPFFTSKPEGMGLGLAVCRSIVEAHSGRLWAENLPAGGARFHFTLPAAES
ncbi:MAG TPA: PAS domain S-box protein [Thermoanaerobaculia bacterium]|nr:PAS domain S-box protein [Thermoanaerobaculia bacterium]